jgi:hypothetical protein
MRKIATVRKGHPEIKRVILHQSDEGVFLFPCSSLEDGSAIGDEWYQTVDGADEVLPGVMGSVPAIGRSSRNRLRVVNRIG